MGDGSTPTFYSALSHTPVRAAGNRIDLSVYRAAGETHYDVFKYKAPAEGLIQVGGPQSTDTVWTDNFEIAYTKVGNRGPLVLLLHGVPCNRAQWEEVQRFLGRFCETIAIDMLGMGESSQPRLYGRKDDPDNETQWHWVNDVAYVEQLMQHEYPERKFIFIADDWGSGIASHYAKEARSWPCTDTSFGEGGKRWNSQCACRSKEFGYSI
jgi:hypothetical protein